LVIQAPHPVFDINTAKQGIYCFRRLLAKAFCMSGTHRCNHTALSECSGSTGVCSGSQSPFRISDMPHSDSSIFQQTTKTLHKAASQPLFVQLHGFYKRTSDPYVIMSNGTRNHSEKGFISRLRQELKVTDDSLTFKIAHRDTGWNRLLGFTNIQGRLINGSNNPCRSGADSASGRFIHIEQEKSRLRADSTGWNKLYQALAGTFSCESGSSAPTGLNPSPVTLYPNPGNGRFTLYGEAISRIQILTLNGREHRRITPNSSAATIPLDLTSMEAGVYLIRILRKRHRPVVKKLMIH